MPEDSNCVALSQVGTASIVRAPCAACKLFATPRRALTNPVPWWAPMGWCTREQLNRRLESASGHRLLTQQVDVDHFAERRRVALAVLEARALDAAVALTVARGT